ncbi:MAG: hypothetical protein ACR2II_03440 [Chthoniobacterales bacterium]
MHKSICFAPIGQKRMQVALEMMLPNYFAARQVRHASLGRGPRPAGKNPASCRYERFRVGQLRRRWPAKTDQLNASRHLFTRRLSLRHDSGDARPAFSCSLGFARC